MSKLAQLAGRSRCSTGPGSGSSMMPDRLEDSAQRAAEGGEQDGVGQAQARGETRQKGDQRQEAGNAEYDSARALHPPVTSVPPVQGHTRNAPQREFFRSP